MAAGAVALGGLAVACGDSESATTSTTIVSKGAAGTSGSGSSSGAGSSDTSAPAGANSEFAAEIEARGAPTLAAVSGPVAELKVTDDVAGTGTAAEAGSTVTVQYVGAVADTGKVFDESWSSGQPVTFPLDRVIPGWSQGLVGMKEGGRRTLVIPAELAYGANPPPGSDIPADAALVFTVDLVKVD
ncbi:MAG: FKBP-type peptidyl-prolyl cis-trans isomerase [Microthrixaceae bacterium]|nr:FKBP-type peptidyl-prolyl cis-trans isomerase [Microthrixaceae bacterium]